MKMKMAFDDFYIGKYTFPKTFTEAHDRHGEQTKVEQMEKKHCKCYYIYFHINPTTKEIFYVGQGLHLGKQDKFYRAYDFKRRSEFWKNIYSKYGVSVFIAETNIEESKIDDLEIFYIKQIGRRNLGLGPLVNLNDGGQGVRNCIVSEATREKMRQSQLGNRNGAGNKGRICTEEEKKKNSEWHLGKTVSEETKEKLRKPKTLETKNRIKNSMKGKNKGKPWSQARIDAQKLRKQNHG
jgi:hypothetical protein